MAAPATLVLPRKTPGLQGDPSLHGMPPVFDLVSLEQALNTTYNYDAHIVTYQIEGERRLSRLNKTAYNFLREIGKTVTCFLIFVDVDNPGHAPWDNMHQIGATYDAVRGTSLGKDAGFYATRHGYRLFWTLPEPLDVRYFDAFAKQLIERLKEDGIEADPACTDWTRLFRLPFATPEGASSPLALPYNFDHGDLLWKPSSLVEQNMPSIAPPNAEWPDSPPQHGRPAHEDCMILKALDNELYKNVKNGKPLSEPGGRTRTMMRAIGLLANKMEPPTPQSIYRVLAYSISIDNRVTPNNGPPPTLQHLWDACKKIASIRMAEIEEKQAFVDAITAIAVRSSQVAGRIIEQNEGGDPEDAPESVLQDDVERRVDEEIMGTLRGRVLLFTASDAYYVLNERLTKLTGEQRYEGPFRGTAVPAMIEKYATKNAPSLRNDKGSLCSLPEIVSKCGIEVRRVNSYIGERGIKFHYPTRTLVEGVAAIRRDLVPEFNPQIDHWLRLMGGSRVDSFLDWLATFIELDKPTCGLYIKSDGGTGKGMLAEGLARMFGSAPTMYANIIGTHNDGLATCPLVWADEEIPASSFGKTPSAIFRTLVGNSVFNLRRMYQPPSTLIGSLRLLVTANNDNALRIHEDLTPEDYQAIVDRIGYIHVDASAKAYIESIGGRKTTEAWVRGDGIAKHVLWLHQNRTVVRGSRFLVKGWESDMHKHLQVTSGVASAVVEVIAHSLSANASKAPEGFFIGNNCIYASVLGVSDMWTTALGESAKLPTKQRIQSALRQLSTTPNFVHVKYFDGYHEAWKAVWPLRSNEILSAMEQYQIGNPEQIREALATVLTVK
jgi:hypothetical protein